MLALLDSPKGRTTTTAGDREAYSYRGSLAPMLKLMGSSDTGPNRIRVKASLKRLPTSAAVKKPVSPKLPQNPGGAETKQGLKTAKAETAVKNLSARFEQSLQPGGGQWNRCRSAGPAQTGRAPGAQVARTGSPSQGCYAEHVCFNACLHSETRGEMDKHKRSQKKGRSF